MEATDGALDSTAEEGARGAARQRGNAATRQRGESAASIARRLEIGERTVYRLQQRQRAGRPVEPDRSGPRRPTKLADADLRLLHELVAQRPGVTAKQAMALLSVEVVESTVCRAWQRLGLSFKKSR